MFPQTWEDPDISNSELGGVAVRTLRSAQDSCLASVDTQAALHFAAPASCMRSAGFRAVPIQLKSQEHMHTIPTFVELTSRPSLESTLPEYLILLTHAS